MLGVILIGNLYEQSYSFISECDVGGVETLYQSQLPAFETVFIEFDQLVQTADAEVLHIVVAIVEKLVYNLTALLDQVVIGIYSANGLDGLLQHALTEVHGQVG